VRLGAAQAQLTASSVASVPVLLALLSAAVWGSADFGGGLLSRRLPVRSVVLLSQLAGLAGVLAVSAATGALASGWGVAAPAWWQLAAAGAGVSGMLGLLAFYSALAGGTMGIVAPVSATGVLVPVAGGLLVGERPGSVQAAGIVLAVVGVVLTSGPEVRGAAAGAAPRTVALALVAALGFGLSLLLLRAASSHGVLVTLTLQRVASVGLLLGVVGTTRQPLAVARRDAPPLATVGLLDVGANAMYALASAGGMASVVGVMGSLYPVATVLLARQVLGERLRGVQAAGVVAAMGGVALLGAG